jgi:hypothetical protein
MAGTISFQNSATGSKGTGGTTFTIGLSSTAGDVVVVAIAYPSNTISVSSVQDANSPPSTYNLISRINNGGITTEVWSSASSPTLLPTGGTITVTVSASGIVCVGVAVSYRGVGVQPGLGTSNIVSSGSSLQSSFTLFVSGGWRVAAFGVASPVVFTATSGSIRAQAIDGTSVVSVCLVDSSGVFPPGSSILSVTIPSPLAYSGVSFEMDPFLDAPSVNYSRSNYGSGRPAVFSNSV